jgi:hypothetical protein
MILTVLLSILLNTQDTVTATTYRLTARENGPYGNVLASGFQANKKDPGSDRIIAVSRDLLKHFPFHTYVTIKGTGKLDGIWRVEDVMNRRFKKRIDFLISRKIKPDKFYKIIIKRYDKHESNIKHRKRRGTGTIHHVRTKPNRKHIKRSSRRSKKARLRTTRQLVQHSYRIRKIPNDPRNIKRRK